MTSTTMPAATRREPLFPRRLFVEQAIFALMVWAGYSVFVFALTFVVSLFRPITISGWDLAGQPGVWFAFAIGCYLGWTVLRLYVTHGGTRRGFLIRSIGFVLVYGLLLTVLFMVTYWPEKGLYALTGWPHVPDDDGLYASLGDVPMVFLQWLLVFELWAIGGLFVSVAWYRGALLGSLSIVLGLVIISVSSFTIKQDIGPMGWVGLLLPGQTGPLPALVAHLIMFALLAGLTWLVVRNISIRGKSVEPA
jgi:hypothetical protein